LRFVIGFGEAVGTRIEFFAVARRLDPERIELWRESARACGRARNQHQGTHRIARRLMDIGRRQFGAFGLRLGGKLGANHLFDFRPVAIERGGSARRAASAASCSGPRMVLRRFSGHRPAGLSSS